MSCPYCEELRRRGIDDPILALEHQMLFNNTYVGIVVEILGYEKAVEIGKRVSAIVDQKQKEGLQ